MALQTKTSLWVPRHLGLSSAQYDTSSLLVDASGEKAAFILRAPATGALKKVAVRTGGVTQNQTIRVSFQDVDPATGYPDGVADQWRNLAIADTDDNVAKETGILSSDGTDGGTLRSVTRGDLLAVVFEHNPFNPGDVFRLSIVHTGGGQDCEGSAYSALYTTSWAKVINTPCVALIYDSGGSEACYHCPNAVPCTQDYGSMTFNSGSANPKRGLKFKLPFPARIAGALVRMRTSGNCEVKLYNSDGQSVLRSQSIVAAATDSSYQRWHHVPFASAVDLAQDTFYYLLVEPTTTTSVYLFYIDVPTGRELYLDQMDGGQEFHYAERSTGAPIATTTRRPLFSLELVALEDGASGGAAGPMIISY